MRLESLCGSCIRKLDMQGKANVHNDVWLMNGSSQADF
jgi:hypothetical protein